MKTKQVIEVIRGLVPKWIELLKLQNWSIDINYMVVHELLHVLVNEMREEGIDHEERVVTHLAKAALGISNA